MRRPAHLPGRSRRAALPALVALLSLGLAALYPGSARPAAPGRLPATVGACTATTVARTGPRLEGEPQSGVGIQYANGGSQVSYEVIPAIRRSRRGDRVEMCLVSIPTGCPPGDDRGRIYRVTNKRTGESWTAPDSQHTCGGA